MNNYLEKLEYNKILEKLSTYAITYLGKDYCSQLLPSDNKEIVKNMLKETEEAVNLLYRCNTPPIYEIADNTINLKILESYGTLSIKSILELSNILTISEKLKKYFYAEHVKSEDFEILNLLFSELYLNNSITEKILNSIIDENTIDDNASKELSNIRRKQRNIEQDIKSKLNTYLHSSSYSKYVQENVVTIRNNRYVIPIKEEYRSQIKGFVHDISSSGSTVFIEPVSVFELNNEIANLKIEENLEIEKILQNLTKLFYPYIEDLKRDICIISQLDFIFAKAKYSKNFDGITPIINDDKKIELINAKHPLLDQNIAVPISLTLGEKYSSLVITGPNTGGKTVTLKTIGLLTAMACSGLNIPATEKTSIYVFDKIFADIGDDQSISDSLSTFSSHMKNIVDIVNNSTENSLILVDELGSGTDPVEGASLAISILSHFRMNNILTVATTHYQELKKYALVTDGFENASVEFDINTLSPTYHLLVGVPGKSNAFEISQKLGLSENIIKVAKSNLTKKDVDFEELLKNIYDNKSQIENEKIEISKELEKVSNLRKSLERDNSKLLEQEREIINNAKINARTILLDAKEEANEIISKMNNYSNSNSELNNLRNQLNKTIKDISISVPDNETSSRNSLAINDAKPNTEVFVTTLGQNGVIVSNISKSNEVQVQIGSMKMSINIKNLEKLKTSNNKNNSTVSYNSVSKTRTAKSELNIIGLNVEEAIFVVDKFLDDSYLAKLETVRIVHGKGTGKLREGIHKFLKTNSHVKSFRLGTYGEGEMGVTVVELK
ncbi:MAG: endonuclease MutS2 [Clostridia bacterium]|jgi:DNA mismatch repair protein MutS2|nr:endonuclease MutS2 [Clostridia bacterium]